MDRENNREELFKQEAATKFRELVHQVLGELQTRPFSIDYRGIKAVATITKVDPNYNGAPCVCVTTDAGEFHPIRSEEFFRMPEVERLLNTRIVKSDSDTMTILAMRKMMQDPKGIQF
jgi:hypothetical protein